jgi:DNA-binding NarL/FixJ family response regulator
MKTHLELKTRSPFSVKLKILIAEARDILRAGLRTILSSDERIGHIYEAVNQQDLQNCLDSYSLDLVIVNQSLISDITILPRGQFVILTPELNMLSFYEAYKHGARGYLLENTSSDLLCTALCLTEGAFLIEPVLVTRVIEAMSGNTSFDISEDLLTPREREVVSLLRDGMDRHTMARHLCISEATLKTHIKNIARKRVKKDIFRKMVS